MNRTAGRRTSVFLAGCLGLVASACDDNLTGPEPTLSELDPQVICTEQLTSLVTIRGDNFSPTVFDSLTGPLVQLPQVTLVAYTDLLGNEVADEVPIPDDPEQPEDSALHWLSRQEMAFEISPELEISEGVWGVRVTNPQGAQATLTQGLLATPPPELFSLEPSSVCTDSGGREVLLRGANFLTIDDSAPAVHLGDQTLESVASDCRDLPWEGVQTCDTLAITLPDALAEDTYPTTVQNPRSAGCVSNALDFQVVPPEPLLLYVDPPIVYDEIPNTLTVYSANFPSDDVTRVELLPPAPDAAIALCDDTDPGLPACSGLPSGRTSGVFTVALAAGTLATLSGSPSEATFGLRVHVLDASCAARMTDALRIVSVPAAGAMSVQPAFGQVGQRTAIAITLSSAGPVFEATPRAYLTNATSGGPLPATAFVSSTSLTAVVPDTFTLACGANCSETFDLVVINPDGTLFVQTAAFTLSTFAPPSIDQITPGQLPGNSVTTVEVTGSGFANNGGDPLASLGCTDALGLPLTVAAPAVTYNDATSLSLTVPAIPSDSACIVRIENVQDGAFDLFSALVVGNSSGNIPQPRDPGVELLAPRRAHGVAAVGATRAARFLYAVGGEDAAAAIDAVEYAALDLFGAPSAFATARYPLDQARAHLGVVRAGRALYAVGGADDTGTAVATVSRAVVLDPAETVAARIDDFELATPQTPGLQPGARLYRVAIVFADTDPINPCGESLPSEPVVIQIPTLQSADYDGLVLTLAWPEPDTTVLGPAFAGRVVAGYRVYRTPAPDDPFSAIAHLADVDGAANTAYVDDGQNPVAVAITGCPEAVPAGQAPLGIGETSRWVSAGVPQLSVPRKGAGVVAALDRGSNKVFLYALSGLDDTGAGLNSYEVLALDHTSDTNPVAWEAGAVWNPTSGILQNTCGGGGGTPRPRWQAGAFVFDHDSSSMDGAAFEITDDAQYVYLGPGLSSVGAAQGAFESWKITPVTGLLDASAYSGVCRSSAASAGYGSIGTNQQVFLFGGVNPTTAINAVQWFVIGGPGSAIEVDTSVNNNGAGMTAPRYLHATVLDRAFIYVVGGEDDLGAVSGSVEFGLW